MILVNIRSQKAILRLIKGGRPARSWWKIMATDPSGGIALSLLHEVNPALRFDRLAARGFRLNIAAGTAVRFEPGQNAKSNWCALLVHKGSWVSQRSDGRTGGR